MFNLLQDAWIPAKRESDCVELIIPSQITDRLDEDPFVSIASARHDIDGAIYQFLIGLMQTTFMPYAVAEWQDRLIDPPSKQELDLSCESFESAFDLNIFMQDSALNKAYFEKKKKAPESITSMLFDSRKPGKDLFQKSERVKVVCKQCLGSVLYNFQASAVQGGAGHRTSIRGGGPATTIITGKNLWETIYANVVSQDSYLSGAYGNLNKNEIGDIFPWKAAPRTSKKNEPVISITEAHPARVYWATPRRIIVDLDSHSDDECACGVCGRRTNDYVTNFYMETYGEKYDLTWRHPLSPYYKRKGKKGIEMLPLHLNKDGVTYSNYPIYAFSDTDVGRNALAVNNYRDNKPKYWSHRDDKHRDDKIMIFGYDAQKTTVNGWYEGKMILSVADKNIRDIYESIVLLLVDVAKYIVSRMKARVARAIDGVPTEIGYLFWKYTEEKFDEILKLLNTELINKFTVYGKNLKNTHVDDVKLMWLSHLSTVALKLYDEFADITTNSSENRMKRIVENRKFLAIEISKGNKEISKLLNLPESDKNGGKHKQKRK